MEVIVDDTFMMQCMRKRIDFLQLFEEKGYRVAVPKEIMQELKSLKKSGTSSREDRIIIDALFEALRKNKVKNVTLGQGKLEDWLIKRGREGICIATTRSDVKRQVPNTIGISEKTGIVVEHKFVL